MIRHFARAAAAFRRIRILAFCATSVFRIRIGAGHARIILAGFATLGAILAAFSIFRLLQIEQRSLHRGVRQAFGIEHRTSAEHAIRSGQLTHLNAALRCRLEIIGN